MSKREIGYSRLLAVPIVAIVSLSCFFMGNARAAAENGSLKTQLYANQPPIFTGGDMSTDGKYLNLRLSDSAATLDIAISDDLFGSPINVGESGKTPVPVRNPIEGAPLQPVSNSIGEFIDDEMPLDDVDLSLPPQWTEHQVLSGEVLIAIASKYNVSVQYIIKANKLAENGNRISAGQVLLIPRDESAIENVIAEIEQRERDREDAKHHAVPVVYKNYVVKNGDSLWSIAEEHNLIVDSITGTNIIKNPNRLKLNDTLRLPNQNGVAIRVNKGDTIQSLVKKYSLSEEAFRKANNLTDSDIIRIGTEVFLPGVSQVMMAYKSTATGGGSSSQGMAVAKVSKDMVGKFIWPVQGKINSKFGFRIHPIKKTRTFHSGIDIKGTRHTPIKAAAAGKVVFSGRMGGYGLVIIISHDGTYSTLYAHCQKLLIRAGSTVKQGDVIATVGSTGLSTGPHLHFEIRADNKVADPLGFLR